MQNLQTLIFSDSQITKNCWYIKKIREVFIEKHKNKSFLLSIQ